MAESKAIKFAAEPALASALSGLRASKMTVGTVAFNATKEAPNAVGDAVVVNKGDVLIVPGAEEMASLCFEHEVSTDRYAYGFLCKTQSGNVKRVYLSTFRKAAVPYKKVGEDIVVAGDAVHAPANNEIYARCSSAGVQREIIDFIASIGDKGKGIKVVDLLPVETARFSRDGETITGIRKTNVPVFEECDL